MEKPPAGTWTKSPSERLAHNGRRQRSRSGTHPNEQPRTTKKRRKTPNATGNVISVGGLEISVKALFIVLMSALLIALIMPSLYQWWRQEQEYQHVLSQVEHARQQQSNVEKQIQLWNNEDFIAAQARERLGYVRPGETQYSVVDPGPEYLESARLGTEAQRGPQRPWIHHFALLTANADATQDTPKTRNVVTNPVLTDQPQSVQQQQSDEPQSQSNQ